MNGSNGNNEPTKGSSSAASTSSTALTTRPGIPSVNIGGSPGPGAGQLTIMPRTIDDLGRLGKMFAQSQLFKDTKQVEQCAVKIMAGLELGLPPMAAMRSLHVFQGQVTLSAPLMASIIKRAKPKYDYKIRTHTDQVCEIEFFEDGESVGTSSFTIEEARKAELAGKDNWKHHPKNMLFSRALSNGAKWYCAELFNGPIYTPDEFGATVDAEGTVIDVTPSPSGVAPRGSSGKAPVGQALPVPVEGEVIEGEARAADEPAETTDWSPVGEVIERLRANEADGEELLATPEERAEVAHKEQEARKVEVERIKVQLKRLGIKDDLRNRLFKLEFGRADMVSVPSWKLRATAEALVQAPNLKMVLEYVRSLDQPALPANPASETSTGAGADDQAEDDLPF